MIFITEFFCKNLQQIFSLGDYIGEKPFKKGEKAMKLRHKVTAMLSAAAVLLVVCAAAVLVSA